MEVATHSAPSTGGPEEVGLEHARELQSLLALRLAHRGWAVRVEVVVGSSGPEIDCRPYAVEDHRVPSGAPIALRVTPEPVERQAARLLSEIEAAGWVPAVGSSGGWTNPRAGTGIWCVPE
jgi:hypothetical protein